MITFEALERQDVMWVRKSILMHLLSTLECICLLYLVCAACACCSCYSLFRDYMRITCAIMKLKAMRLLQMVGCQAQHRSLMHCHAEHCTAGEAL